MVSLISVTLITLFLVCNLLFIMKVHYMERIKVLKNEQLGFFSTFSQLTHFPDVKPTDSKELRRLVEKHNSIGMYAIRLAVMLFLLVILLVIIPESCVSK